MCSLSKSSSCLVTHPYVCVCASECVCVWWGAGQVGGQLAYQLVGHGVNTFNVVAIVVAVAIAIAWLQLLLLASWLAGEPSESRSHAAMEPWSHLATELVLFWRRLLCHV